MKDKKQKEKAKNILIDIINIEKKLNDPDLQEHLDLLKTL